jgi:hypothetical protein
MRAILVMSLLFVAAVDAGAQARMELVPSASFSTAYDGNIFTTHDGRGDAMMLVTPALEARYESPTTLLRGIYTFDMQRAVGFSTLNSLDARRHALVDTAFQLTPQFNVSLVGRYDESDRPSDLLFDTSVLLGRERARRYQVTPAIAVRVRPKTTITAQYDITKEALGGDMGGDMNIARLGVAHVRSPRDAWSLNYLGRTFANDADMFHPATTEHSHALLAGYTRAIGVGTDVNVQAGPRTSSYGNRKPEVLANFTRRIRAGRYGLDYWQGETIILGIRGPVDIHSFTFKSSWPIRRRFELGAHAGAFKSDTLFQGRARVFHPELVASYIPGRRYIVSASYGVDFQKGDVRSQLLSDKEIVRHVLLVRITFAPRLSRVRPADPDDPRSKGVLR